MAKTRPRIIVTIDSNTVFRTLLILTGALFLYYVRDVLVIAFVAFIIVSAIAPIVDYLEKFYLPRSLVVLTIYAIAIGGLFYFLSLLVPAIGDQIKQLSHNLPLYSEKLNLMQEKIQYLFGSGSNIVQKERSDFLLNLGNRLNENWWNIFSQAGSFIAGIINFVAVFSLAFFLSIQKKSVGKFLQSFIPSHHQDYAVKLVERIQQKMGHWLLGQMVLNIIVGALVYIGLTLLNVPYALLLAIVSAAFEVVPYVGPVLSAALGILVALSISPVTALIVLAMYIIIQQSEAHLLVPLVMKQAVGLNPVAVVIALLMGIKLGGALGLILAIPITAAISVFVSDFITPSENQKV